MRTLFLSFLLLPAAAFAQCTFNPTVTPDNLILCPEEVSTLSTQEYDSYQWYKNGDAIDGATSQTLDVEQFADAGSEFSVEATLDGCTEMSPAVLVDGWMFLLPHVIHGGDEPHTIGMEGESYFCEGDTMTLTMGQPYTTSITWFRNGAPIDGENGVTLEVTTSGSYTSSGAPEVCPNYISNLGVDVLVFFQAPAQATIVEGLDGELCAEPVGDTYTWYLDGEPLDGVDMACFTPEIGGAYTVFVDYGNDCQIISEPFLITGIGEAAARTFSVAPNPASNVVRITWNETLRPTGAWVLNDITGRAVMTGSFNGNTALQLDLTGVQEGNYLFSAMGATPLRLVVKR